MAYAIMRFEKHKAANLSSLAGSLSHTFRSRFTPNADPEKRLDNETLVGVSDPHAIIEAVRGRFPDKIKSNNVGCYEFLIAYSPEADIDPAAYFDRAISWLQSEFGVENVVSVERHNDESTPHLAAYVVPIDPDTGNLNARRWTGGKALCSAMQTRFWEHAGRDLGLDRGIKGSQARHTSIAHWYGAHQTLDERENVLKAREKELSQREKELSAAKRSLQADLSDLSERETALEARAAEMADSYMEQQKDLSRQREALQNSMSRSEKAEIRVNRAESKLSEREAALGQRQAALDARDIELEERRGQISKTEQKLAALERELSARGETLAGGEKALEQRQAEIERAGSILRQKLDAARVAQEQFEQQKAAWIAANRPALPPLVQHLKHLETLGTVASAEYLEAQDDSELHDLFCPLDGITKKGRALLDRYKNVQERAEKFEETFTPSSSAPGL